MGNLGYGVKTAFLKGLEALGKTASNLTDAAQHKLSEMNLENRRREVLASIPKCVMQMWKDGVELPEPLSDLLNELADVEQQLSAMRPQPKASPAEETPSAEEVAEEETEVEALEEPAEEEAPACESSEETACEVEKAEEVKEE